MPDNIVSVVFTSDDVTAIPMGVAIASILKTRALETTLDFHVFSCGITRASRSKIEEIFQGLKINTATLSWHDITRENSLLLEKFFIKSDRPYPPASYARLLVGDILPQSVRKVIYLDVDMTVLTDLRPLWDYDMKGKALLAVLDLPHDRGRIERLINTLDPQERKKYAVDRTPGYFQSGMLVIDIDAFRGNFLKDISALLLKYPQLRFPDQDALNIMFATSCILIDPRWNSVSAVYWYKDPAESPYATDVLTELQERPFIIHFSGRPKPWETGCTHPLMRHWLAASDAVPWAQHQMSAAQRVGKYARRVYRVLFKKVRRLF